MALQVEDSLDEDTIKRAWSKAEIDPELAAHADDILDESDPDLVNVTVQASKPGGKELMMLRAAAQRANEELSNVWLGCREQFLAKWMGPGGDGAQAQPPVDPLERAAARLSALRRARTNVLGLAKGNYRSAMLYCPELSSKELCKEPSSSTQSSDVPPADDRQRSKSLEALLAPSFVELVSLVGSGNLRRNDRFLLFIKTKLSKMGKQDDFSVIAAMRHLVLTAYCFLVVAETMEIALDRVLMCIPGYSEGEIKATSRSAATRSPVPPTPVAAGAAGGPAAGTDIPDDIRAFSDDIFKNTPFVSTSNKARTRATPPANSRYAPASTLANNSSGRKCTFVRCGHREKDGQTFQVCGPCRRAGIQVPYCRYALGPLAAKRSPFVRSMYMRFDCSCACLALSLACVQPRMPDSRLEGVTQAAVRIATSQLLDGCREHHQRCRIVSHTIRSCRGFLGRCHHCRRGASDRKACCRWSRRCLESRPHARRGQRRATTAIVSIAVPASSGSTIQQHKHSSAVSESMCVSSDINQPTDRSIEIHLPIIQPSIQTQALVCNLISSHDSNAAALTTRGISMDSERRRGVWFGPQSRCCTRRWTVSPVFFSPVALSSTATMHVSLRAQSLFAAVLVATVLACSCASSLPARSLAVPPAQRTSCVRGCSARQRLMTRDPSTQVKRWSSSTTPPTAPLGFLVLTGSRAIHASTAGIESRARAISLPRCTYSRASRPRTLAGARDIDRRHVVPARWAAIISKEPSHRPSASSAA